MKKFEFRLASVLRLRDVQLALEEGKLQRLFAEKQKLKQMLNQIDAERGRSVDWFQRSAVVDGSDFRVLSAFLLGSNARKESAIRAMAVCDKNIDEQRGQVLIAERNQKLLLKLKEKQLSAWQLDASRELETIAQEAWQAASRRTVNLQAEEPAV